MSLETLSTDIILLIMQFIPDNFSSVSFIETCKYIRNIGLKYGYVKHIEFNYQINFFDFAENCGKHENSIWSIKMQDVRNPQLWIPMRWPKVVSIHNCAISDYIDPPVSGTEEIEIANCYDSVVNINWKKFPNLKHINISCKNINFSGIENCTNIESISIQLSKTNFIPSLDKLGQISTNCYIITPNSYFISGKFIKNII